MEVISQTLRNAMIAKRSELGAILDSVKRFRVERDSLKSEFGLLVQRLRGEMVSKSNKALEKIKALRDQSELKRKLADENRVLYLEELRLKLELD